MTDTTFELVEILEQGEADQPVNMASPRTLYERWETNPWSVQELDVPADREAWAALPEFVRIELRDVLDQLLTGEMCVTDTLSPLVDHAPTNDERIFLATQIADEARHVRFFEEYERSVLAANGEGCARDDSFGRHFEDVVRERTAAIRGDGAGAGTWYAGLASYHLVTEGILASTALRSTLQTVKRGNVLPSLAAGLKNVAKDESRHVQFGIGAAQRGIAAGHGEELLRSYLDALERCPRVLLDPDREVAVPELPGLAAFQQRRRRDQLEFAHKKMRRVLTAVGGRQLLDEAERRWRESAEAALSEYSVRFGRPHPAVAEFAN